MENVPCKNLKRRPDPAELPGKLIKVVNTDDYVRLPTSMREAGLYRFICDAIIRLPKISAIQVGDTDFYVIRDERKTKDKKGKKDKKHVTHQQPQKPHFTIEHYSGKNMDSDYLVNVVINPEIKDKIFFFEDDGRMPNNNDTQCKLMLLANFMAFLFIYEYLFPDENKVREIDLKRQSVRDMLDEKNMKGFSWKGAEVSITQENLYWYRELVQSSKDTAKFEELLSQEKLVMKKMEIDGAVVEILRKSEDIYTIKYSWENDFYRVNYDARNGQVVKVWSSYWNDNQTAVKEHAERICKDAILIMYYLWATGFEYEEGKICTLERFEFFGQMPGEVA